MVFRKKGCTQVFPLVSGILQTKALSILGVTFQEDCRFTTHVRNKLIKANKWSFYTEIVKEGGLYSGKIRLSVSKSSYP